MLKLTPCDDPKSQVVSVSQVEESNSKPRQHAREGYTWRSSWFASTSQIYYKRAIYLCERDCRVLRLQKYQCRKVQGPLQYRKKRSPDRLQISIMRNLGDNSRSQEQGALRVFMYVATIAAWRLRASYPAWQPWNRGWMGHHHSVNDGGGQTRGSRQVRRSAETSGRMEQVCGRKSISEGNRMIWHIFVNEQEDSVYLIIPHID